MAFEIVGIPGSVTTTATTADQVVVSYTVPVGRTFLLEFFRIQCRSTSPPGNPNPVVFGNASLELPSGSKRFTMDLLGNVAAGSGPQGVDLPVGWQATESQVIRIVCTPAAATSFLWRANIGGRLESI